MRSDHKNIFRKAAKEFNCEIVVRAQNKASEQYVGKRGYKPKPLQCKAKTAAKGDQAGLVASPLLCPFAFERDKLSKAIAFWKQFEKQMLSGRNGFMVDTTTPKRYGCVLFRGDYLYSDYDLMAVNPVSGGADKPKVHPPVFQRNTIHPDKENKKPPRVAAKNPNANITNAQEIQVAKFIYERTGIQLIQHGSQAGYWAFSETPPAKEKCHVFRPRKPFYRYESYPK